MEEHNMATYTLLENDNIALTIPLSGCSEDLDRKELKENLIETMKNFHGIGLSANQCGIMERVFVMYSDIKKKKIIACFNPQVISEGTEMVTMDEGCLTWPGIWIKIRRPDHIACTFEDENGELNRVTMMGLECRIFQHEMDHMSGTNFTNRVSKLKMDMAKKRATKMKKKSMISMT
jgi:peptide deformylase